jgi:hypothetical protein
MAAPRAGRHASAPVAGAIAVVAPVSMGVAAVGWLPEVVQTRIQRVRARTSRVGRAARIAAGPAGAAGRRSPRNPSLACGATRGVRPAVRARATRGAASTRAGATSRAAARARFAACRGARLAAAGAAGAAGRGPARAPAGSAGAARPGVRIGLRWRLVAAAGARHGPQARKNGCGTNALCHGPRFSRGAVCSPIARSVDPSRARLEGVIPIGSQAVEKNRGRSSAYMTSAIIASASSHSEFGIVSRGPF